MTDGSAHNDQNANPHRGEASLSVAGRTHKLRPTFTALIAAEGELGPLFALVERAGDGQLRIDEMTALFWYCLTDQETVTREQIGTAVVEMGLAACAKPLRALLGQILQGA